MVKYHINKKGIPAICRAKRGNCPFGGDEQHFATEAEAQKHVDEVSKEKHGLLPSSNNDSEDIEKLKIKEEWRARFLEHDDFEEFAKNHASDVVKSGMFNKGGDMYEQVKSTWKTIHYENSSLNLSELSDENAIEVVLENTRPQDLSGWFREYDSDYKPRIEHSIITQPELRNASLNIAHRVYRESTGSEVSFEEFMDSEIEVYRGGNFSFVENDVFVSYSFDKEVAEKFAKSNGSKEVHSKKVRIKDTLGSLQTTGEAELMIRRT